MPLLALPRCHRTCAQTPAGARGRPSPSRVRDRQTGRSSGNRKTFACELGVVSESGGSRRSLLWYCCTPAGAYARAAAAASTADAAVAAAALRAAADLDTDVVTVKENPGDGLVQEEALLVYVPVHVTPLTLATTLAVQPLKVTEAVEPS